MSHRTISLRFKLHLDTAGRRHHISTLRLAASLLLAVCAFGPVSAQIARPNGEQSRASHAGVVAATTDQGVRFTAASGGVVEMRLEVFSFAGEKVFDSNFRRGSVLDWLVGDGATGQYTLPDDEYLCVVTLSDLSGRLRQRRGVTSLRAGRVALASPGASQLSTAQSEAAAASRRSQLVAEDDEDDSLTIFGGDTSSLTVSAHDGQVGQLTSTTGALTFRTGDLFAGKDVERVRITPAGNVGIGTGKPQATLDVAGSIRAAGVLHAAGGLEFADGSRLNSTDGKLLRTGATGEPLVPEVDGTGTTGRLPKWTNGPTGTLGDSLLGEAAGGIELRPATPGVGVNPTLTNFGNVAGFAQVSFYPVTGPNTNMSFSVVPRGTGAAGNLAQFSIFNTDLGASPINYEFAALRARGSDFVLGTGKSGTGVNRPFMFASGFLSDNTTNNGQLYLASNGNVGVGTVSPVEKLDVVGNIKASGSVAGATASISGNLTALTATISSTLTVDTTTLHVDAANNRVGIGTTAPNAPLDVVGAINSSTQYNLSGSRILSNAGVANLFVGVGTGTVNTGTSNSFVGSGAGSANTTGSLNSFFGTGAGNSNTTGGSNSFFGRFAGSLNTTGASNSFFGESAGAANTAGGVNSFFGLSAGLVNTTGANNSFFGGQAGTGNTTGANNSFFGRSAGAANTTGGTNSFFGRSAGNANTTGASNSFFGHSTGLSNTTESNNTFIGANSNGAGGITNATAVGANASVLQSDSLVLGSGVNVGIGTSNPAEKLDVVGNIKASGSLTGATGSVTGNLTVDTSTLHVDATNNRVGVGTTTPGVPLDVVGAINSSIEYNLGGSRVLSNAGVDNLFVGVGAGAVNTGGSNSFFGKSAGAANTTGAFNSFFGKSAGAANTTACCNSFFGFLAGVANTTGANNSFFGTQAGFANTTGSHNSFFGNNAGGVNTTGDSNSFFGRLAGFHNTTGATNAFFGDNAGAANTTASDNSFFGASAGAANTSGTSNSFFGKGAGAANTTGNLNSFFGTLTGAANTTGGSNSFFGQSAGAVNTGSLNSFFGSSAGAANTSGASNAFFGRRAGAVNTTASDNAFFGESAGPANTEGASNSFFGTNAGDANTTGSTNTFVGRAAGLSNTTENDNTFIGANSNGAAGITNATAIGANAVVTQSDSIVLGSGAKVGLGSSAPSEKLHVIGNIFVSGNPAMGPNGLILKSPNGNTCAKLTIDNAGALVTTVIACP